MKDTQNPKHRRGSSPSSSKKRGAASASGKTAQQNKTSSLKGGVRSSGGGGGGGSNSSTTESKRIPVIDVNAAPRDANRPQTPTNESVMPSVDGQVSEKQSDATVRIRVRSDRDGFC